MNGAGVTKKKRRSSGVPMIVESNIFVFTSILTDVGLLCIAFLDGVFGEYRITYDQDPGGYTISYTLIITAVILVVHVFLRNRDGMIEVSMKRADRQIALGSCSLGLAFVASEGFCTLARVGEISVGSDKRYCAILISCITDNGCDLIFDIVGFVLLAITLRTVSKIDYKEIERDHDRKQEGIALRAKEGSNDG